MNKLIYFIILFGITIVISGCSKDTPMGGAVPLDINSSETAAAVEFLKKELSLRHPDVLITRVVSAESQIVQGQKIFLICEYLSDLNKEPSKLSVVLFKTLDGRFSVEKLEFE